MFASLKTGTPTAAFTGGTSAPISWMGRVGQTVMGYFGATASLRSRSTIKVTVKEPKLVNASTGGFSQARRSCVITVPCVITEGATTRVAYNKVNIEIASDVATPDASVDELAALGGQFLTDPANAALFRMLAI